LFYHRSCAQQVACPKLYGIIEEGNYAGDAR